MCAGAGVMAYGMEGVDAELIFVEGLQIKGVESRKYVTHVVCLKAMGLCV